MHLLKIYRIRKKQSKLKIINVYAPHMGRPAEESTAFYKELRKYLKTVKGEEYIITGDFNAKLGMTSGKEKEKRNHVGSYARGRINDNGDHLYKLLTGFNLIACNTFFKNRACHITTWQTKRKGKMIYNQIDYIVAKMARKTTIVNSRSYINHQINTDHRLVIAKFKTKQILETSTATKRPMKKNDETILFLSNKQKELLSKIQKSTNSRKIKKWKKKRNRLFNAIKRRKAYLIAKKYMDQAEELNQAKDNAQTALALKKLFQEHKPKVKGPSTGTSPSTWLNWPNFIKAASSESTNMK